MEKNTNDKLWKISHIHNSIADGRAGEDTNFNLSIAQSNYEEINDSINKASNTDKLTNINNARGFEQDLNRLLRENKTSKYALVKFGIKNFRFINQKYSFEVGDEVLKNIAKNLNNSINENETCGRIEKDNFAMLYHIENKEQLEKRLLTVRETLIDRSLYNKLDFEINLKAGVYFIKDSHEITKEILDKALIAMQSITHISQMNIPIYYEEGMLEKQYFNSRIIEEAPRAIANDEFELYIQPQFDIRTREIISGEALTRWRLPNGDLQMPNTFIPAFEQYGMILAFDFYMLEKLCKQLRKWIDQGIAIYPISINQSRLHINERNYLNDFCKIVDQYKIPHQYITFELTESAFIDDGEKMIELADGIKEKGFQLAIDDFGTGYASINLLADINADILKLDRGLLTNCHFNKRLQKITEMIITLSHSLGMRVVAEGIETEEQLAFLRNIQCDIGQGYLIGKPIEAKEFIKNWLNS